MTITVKVITDIGASSVDCIKEMCRLATILDVNISAMVEGVFFKVSPGLSYKTEISRFYSEKRNLEQRYLT